MTPQQFIALLLAPAQTTQSATGIPASFTIAQAAIESGWGSSQQCLQDCNYFGIKAIGRWTGATQNWETREVVNGHSVFVMAAFRKYPNLTAGLEDHASFLVHNPRYAAAFQRQDDAIAFTQAVAAAGYATDPDYAQKIISIINTHNLKQYDKVEL